MHAAWSRRLRLVPVLVLSRAKGVAAMLKLESRTHGAGVGAAPDVQAVKPHKVKTSYLDEFLCRSASDSRPTPCIRLARQP